MALCSCFIPVGLITRPARTQGQGRGHAWTHARAQWGCKQAGTDSVAERLRCVGGASVATLAFSACVLVNGTPHQAGNHLSPAEPSVGVVCGTFHTGAYVCLRSRRSRSPPGGCEQARPPAKREHATHRCCRLPDTRRGESKAQSRRRHVCCLQNFWSRLSGKYGNKFWWCDHDRPCPRMLHALMLHTCMRRAQHCSDCGRGSVAQAGEGPGGGHCERGERDRHVLQGARGQAAVHQDPGAV